MTHMIESSRWSRLYVKPILFSENMTVSKSRINRALILSLLVFSVYSPRCLGAVLLNTADKVELDRSVKAKEGPTASVILFCFAQAVWLLAALFCICRRKCAKPQTTDEFDASNDRTMVDLTPGSEQSFFSTRDYVSTTPTATRITVPTECTGAALKTKKDEQIIEYSIASLDDRELLCPICLDLFQSEKDSACLSCTHVFHLHCLQKWIAKSPIPACPVCRHDLRIQS